MRQTTLAHIMLERLADKIPETTYPDNIKGNLVEEHNWTISFLIRTQRELFEQVCKEIDEMIADGRAHFGDDGVITLLE
jgi:hypothetical protein